MNWKHWAHGLLAAFIGGAVNVVADLALDADVDPLKLAKKATLAGVIFAAAYLKQSPLPGDSK